LADRRNCDLRGSSREFPALGLREEERKRGRLGGPSLKLSEKEGEKQIRSFTFSCGGMGTRIEKKKKKKSKLSKGGEAEAKWS